MLPSHKPCEGRDHPDGGSDQQTSSLQTFVEELLSTNKSQTSDSRTAASTRVIDKTILLDNPTKQAGAGVQAGLVRYALTFLVPAAGHYP